MLATAIDRARLSRRAPRAARAGAMVETRLLDPNSAPLRALPREDRDRNNFV